MFGNITYRLQKKHPGWYRSRDESAEIVLRGLTLETDTRMSMMECL